MRSLALLLVLLGCLSLLARLTAEKELPTVKSWESPDRRYLARTCGEEPGRLEVRALPSRQLLWSQSCGEPGCVQLEWCPDSSHLAALETPCHGEPRLTVYDPSGARHYTGDWLSGEGELDMTFSPDFLHLLVRIPPVFGNYDVDVGNLWCLDLSTGRARCLDKRCRRAEWNDAESFSCWSVTDSSGFDPDTWPLECRTFQAP